MRAMPDETNIRSKRRRAAATYMAIALISLVLAAASAVIWFRVGDWKRLVFTTGIPFAGFVFYSINGARLWSQSKHP